MVIPNLVVPSIPHLTYGLFKFLSNHPLFLSPLVLHPETKDPVYVDAYRFMQGFPLEDGLVCSIYPAYGSASNAPLSPTSTSASVLYHPHDMGSNYDEAMFHFVIEFSMREVVYPGSNQSFETDLITVPKDAMVFPNQRKKTQLGTKEVDLYINPPMDIIGDYLELTRLAISDVAHRDIFPITVSSMEVLHTNYKAEKWETNDNIIHHSGYAYLRLNAFISRGWRDKFLVPLEKINLQLNSSGTDIVPYSEEDEKFRKGIYELFGDIIEPGFFLRNIIPVSQKGAPFGVASLDKNGNILLDQIPPELLLNTSEGLASHINNPEAHPQYTKVGHSHVIENVEGLTQALNSKQDHTDTLDTLNTLVTQTGLLASNGVSYLIQDTLDGGLF